MPGDSGIHGGEASDQNAPGLTLPKWFLITTTGILGTIGITFLPWSVWVTLMLLDYTNVRDVRGEVLSDHKARLAILEQSRENHALQLQSIGASRFTSEQANAIRDGLQSEIRAVSTELKALQRDFDRNFGKPKGATVEPFELETTGE